MSVAKRRIVSGIVLLCVAAGMLWAWSSRQFLQDWWAVQEYTPSSEIARVAERVAMSDVGEFLFYASKPVISGPDEFNQQCDRREAKTAILGCYWGGRIYIYQIDREELDGAKEVTAAHEMLHAAWARLSDTERSQLSVHLKRSYEQIKTPELEERMAYYDRQQPGERMNELHSILGTEMGRLDEKLERHYAQYFTDRQRVVGLHDAYASIFRALQNQAEQLRAELTDTINHLNEDIASFNQRAMRLEEEVVAHNGQSHEVDGANAHAVAVYNARRSDLMARHAQLGREEADLDRRRNEYQQKVQRYNELAIRSESLADSLDSLKTPPVQAE